MKVKTIVIALLVTAAAAGGIGCGIYYVSRSKGKPVKVVPIENVNYGYWGDNETSQGMIISMDSQTVQLNSEYELKKVYVETGDEVKIGDPLLEYDMTLAELRYEMQDLTKQSLELNLKSMEKDLQKLKNTSPTASVAVREGVMTAAEDGFLEEESSGENSSGNAAAPEDDLILDEDTEKNETAGETEHTIPEDSTIIEDDDLTSEEVPVVSEEAVEQINAFLTRVNQLSAQELDQLIASDISEALRIFQEKLSVSSEEKTVDVFGNTRTIRHYVLNPAVTELVGESTAQVLEQAYDRACVYQFIYWMNQLTQGEASVEEMTDEAIRSLEEQILAAADAYYGIPQSAFETYAETLTLYTETLGSYVARLNNMNVVEETEASSEMESEGFEGGDDYGGFDLSGGDGDGYSYTAEELKTAIEDQEREIEECQLQIREAELKMKQYQRSLDNKIVKSSMNGVVKSAGTMEDTLAGDDFIIIAGAAGMYVQGTINELKLDTVKVGDTVSGMSYDVGMNFTATITEISSYPSGGEDGYYGFGTDNANASYYPFLAYIEDAEGLTEGYVELQFVKNTSSSGIYLEKYFILEESSGQEYVYIQGEDGLLKKQYVKTGITIYGSAKQILSGLSMTDKIAFPYGKDVVEGAATQEADSLYDDYYY